MDCAEVKENLGCYIDGELDPHHLEQMEEHLEGCSACSQELASLRLTIATAQDIEQIEPPPHLKEVILAAARRSDAKAAICGKIGALLSAYLDGELTAREQNMVADHIAVCSECAREMRALQVLVGAAASIAPVDPPTDLKARIAAATTARLPGAAAQPVLVERLRYLLSPKGLRWAGAAAAGTAAIAVLLHQHPGPAVVHQMASVHKMHPPVHSGLKSEPSKTAAVASAAGGVQIEMPMPDILAYAGKPGMKRSINRMPQIQEPKLNLIQKPKAKSKPEAAKAPGISVAPYDNTLKTTGSDDMNMNQQPEVASAPEPAPEINDEAPKTVQPTLIKVAAAPVLKQQVSEDWLKQAKAQAAMKRGDSGSGFTVISAKF